MPVLPVEAAGKDAQGEVRNPGAAPAVAVGFTYRSARSPGTFPPHGMAFELLTSAPVLALDELAGRATVSPAAMAPATPRPGTPRP